MSESGCSTPSTPGSQALMAMETLGKEDIFKIPKGPAPKRNKLKVLDEDTYIEEMGKIIERDFFPDLQKLKAQNDYLDAMERNDMQKLREIYLKYSGGRPPTERFASPATFETPADLHNKHKSNEVGSEKTPSNTSTTSNTTETNNEKKKII